MLETIVKLWGAIKSALGGKRMIQIGKENMSVSGVTVGDSSSLVIANNVQVNHAPKVDVPKEIVFKPTRAEVDILLRLAESRTQYLHLARFDGGCVVVIGEHQFDGLSGEHSSVELYEAVQHLLDNGFLTDLNKDGEIYHLSSKGSIGASQLRVQLGDKPKSENQ
ncbi:MAG: hypothetical protein SH850_12330 [Planctomycetaceae bacterium]|nr:hypothetical protein [Planctomycetaceae bacterium]